MFSASTLCARAVAVGSHNAATPQLLLRRCGSGYVTSCRAQRSFMSTQPLSSPDEEPHMILILGKPGGGKGTISGKLLKVSVCVARARATATAEERADEYPMCR